MRVRMSNGSKTQIGRSYQPLRAVKGELHRLVPATLLQANLLLGKDFRVICGCLRLRLN